MTLRKWITVASGLGACKENPNGPGGSSKSPSSTEPQGRRGDMPSRTPPSSPGATPSSPSSTDSTGGSSSGSSSDTTKR